MSVKAGIIVYLSSLGLNQLNLLMQEILIITQSLILLQNSSNSKNICFVGLAVMSNATNYCCNNIMC